MLNCPNCKVQSRVIDTRYAGTEPPHIRRSRRCPKCNKGWSTIELIASDIQTAKQRLKAGRNRRLIDPIRKSSCANLSEELHRLADRVAIGDLE